jgi:small subunit ribosomal protein S6
LGACLLVDSRGFLPRTGSPVPGGAIPGEADKTEGRRVREPVTKYEILLLLEPELDDERQGEIVTRVRELVEKGDGSWDLHDDWGRRRLAYEIGHKSEGSYHLLHFTSDAGTLDEISRVLRIDDGVMRHMATRRIPGSPARPVAVSAPVRHDAVREDAVRDDAGSQEGGREDAAAPTEVDAPEPADEATGASEVEEAAAPDAEVDAELIEVAASSEVEEEE